MWSHRNLCTSINHPSRVTMWYSALRFLGFLMVFRAAKFWEKNPSEICIFWFFNFLTHCCYLCGIFEFFEFFFSFHFSDTICIIIFTDFLNNFEKKIFIAKICTVLAQKYKKTTKSNLSKLKCLIIRKNGTTGLLLLWQRKRKFFWENFDFWPKFHFLGKFSIFWRTFRLLANLSIFGENCDLIPKISVIWQKFQF